MDDLQQFDAGAEFDEDADLALPDPTQAPLAEDAQEPWAPGQPGLSDQPPLPPSVVETQEPWAPGQPGLSDQPPLPPSLEDWDAPMPGSAEQSPIQSPPSADPDTACGGPTTGSTAANQSVIPSRQPGGPKLVDDPTAANQSVIPSRQPGGPKLVDDPTAANQSVIPSRQPGGPKLVDDPTAANQSVIPSRQPGGPKLVDDPTAANQSVIPSRQPGGPKLVDDPTAANQSVIPSRQPGGPKLVDDPTAANQSVIPSRQPGGPKLVDDPTAANQSVIPSRQPGGPKLASTAPVASVIEQITGQPCSEADLSSIVADHGLVLDCDGVVTLLAEQGVEARVEEGTIEALREVFERGRPVSITVEPGELETAEGPVVVTQQTTLNLVGFDDDKREVQFMSETPGRASQRLSLSQSALDDAWSSNGRRMVTTAAPAPTGVHAPEAMQSTARPPLRATPAGAVRTPDDDSWPPGVVLVPLGVAAGALGGAVLVKKITRSQPE